MAGTTSKGEVVTTPVEQVPQPWRGVSAAGQLKDGLRFTHGFGSSLWDETGRKYLDFSSGVLVLAAGHSHPRIVRAISDQAARLINCYAHPNDLRDELAQRLLNIAGAPFDRVIFMTTGSEAIDTGLKIARHHTRRTGVLTFSGAFHGKTMAGIGLAGLHDSRELFGTTLPGPVTRAPYPYPYRWEFGEPMDEVALHLARELVEREGREQFGAIVIEPFLGAGGVVSASGEFLRGIRALADDIEAVLIFDEIQSGLGRCGAWFAYQEIGVVPDVVVGAKHLGGGLPIVALLTTGAVLDNLPDSVLTSTFGGNPLSCAAAVACLSVIDEEGLIANCKAASELVSATLNDWSREYWFVAEGRVVGLSCGIELITGDKEPATRAASKARLLAAEEGLVILPAAGVHANVVRFAPPLSITSQETKEGLAKLNLVMNRIAADWPGG